MEKLWQRIPSVPFDRLGGIVLVTSIFANPLLFVYTSDKITAWISKPVSAAVPILGVEKVCCVLKDYKMVSRLDK